MTMTASTDAARVVPFEVPPVVKEIQVACDPALAFARFTAQIGHWWPVATHSMNRAPGTRVAFEPALGGRLFERGADGLEHTWGRVTAWEPPARVAFSWHVGRGPEAAQSIEVSFAARDGGTLVRLVHAGWETLGERAQATRDEYDKGWDLVFMQRYRRHAETRQSGG